jgi:DNA-binding transcriptional ArsR family regulator
MSNIDMTPEVLELVAARFKALAEPTRLRILSVLREGERTVTDLVDETGLGQANVSKHLQILHDLRYVDRRREGLYTVYSLADEDVSALCDIVCGRLEREVEKASRVVIGG